MTEHRYTMTIEQCCRWGPFKWHGDVLWQWRPMLVPCDPERWSLGLSYEYGWSSWSRSRLERKLRRHIARERKRHAWKATAERQEIVA